MEAFGVAAIGSSGSAIEYSCGTIDHFFCELRRGTHHWRLSLSDIVWVQWIEWVVCGTE
jgi:hypothetical protein